MKASDLNMVNKLMENLNLLMREHQALDSLLHADKWGLQQKVRLEIGGDEYGNGRYMTEIVDINDVKYVVDLICKRKSEVWGKVVATRMKLRDLGVEPNV